MEAFHTLVVIAPKTGNTAGGIRIGNAHAAIHDERSAIETILMTVRQTTWVIVADLAGAKRLARVITDSAIALDRRHDSTYG